MSGAHGSVPAGGVRAVHVAVVRRVYAEAMLAGAKTVESRLSINRVPPFGVIGVGDEIYFKQSSGPFRLRAVAADVVCMSGLLPSRVDALRRKFNHAIGAPRSYWDAKRTARYATLITLADVEPVNVGPDIPRLHGRAWLRLAAEPRTSHTHRRRASA
jgi:hypothetical protein